jgi:hypothetical protein
VYYTCRSFKYIIDRRSVFVLLILTHFSANINYRITEIFVWLTYTTVLITPLLMYLELRAYYHSGNYHLDLSNYEYVTMCHSLNVVLYL